MCHTTLQVYPLAFITDSRTISTPTGVTLAQLVKASVGQEAFRAYTPSAAKTMTPGAETVLGQVPIHSGSRECTLPKSVSELKQWCQPGS